MAEAEPPAGAGELLPREGAEQLPVSPEAPAEDELLASVKVRGGKLFEFLHHGLRITTSRGLFGKPQVEQVPWDVFQQCRVDVACFSGTLTLTQADGQTLALRLPPARLRELAPAIYKRINMGKERAVSPGIQEATGKRSKVTILGSGLVFGQTTGCCKYSSTFVPWQAVASLDLRPGCLGSGIAVNTLLEQHEAHEVHDEDPSAGGAHEAQDGEPAPEAGDEAGKDAEGEEEKKPEKKDKAKQGPAHVVVKLSGKAPAMESVFQELVKLVGSGQPSAESPDAEAGEGDTKIGTASLSGPGILVTEKKRQHFLPWRSVMSVNMHAPYLGSPTLVLTDCAGAATRVRRLKPEDFDTLRARISGATSGHSDNGDGMQPLVIGKVRLMADGVSLTKSHLCSSDTRFLPWSEVDSLRVDTHCCGGTIALKTETGEVIPLLRAGPFGTAAMAGVASRVLDMKYGRGETGSANPRTFAGAEGSPSACVLTDRWLRVVLSAGPCAHVARVLDLDAVSGCEAVAGKRKLLVQVNAAMEVDGDAAAEGVQPLEVPLKRHDDAQDIARDILQRAHARKSCQ